MITMKLSAAARALSASYLGEDVEFRGCSTDSRNAGPGELFIAIKGERFDGHDFLESARQRGAVAAMVTKSDQQGLPTLVVRDTRRAMGTLAGVWRSGFAIPLIAVTGSNGKTTVKEMLVSILGLKAPVLATKGNLNNDIGVPLTLFGLGEEHRYAVVEMGANHPGEISWLSHIARPTVALITQCAPAHLEGFGSVEGVARAKAEIFDGLDSGGVAVINADDDFAGFWRNKVATFRQISFGLDNPADITARSIKTSRSKGTNNFQLCTPAGVIGIELPLLGQHNIMNAMAATACALALDINPGLIKQGLERMKPVKGRLQVKQGLNSSRIIDDTYNANPVSLAAAMKVVSGFSGRRWLALGDMGELGAEGENLHLEAGNAARENGIEKVFAIGPLSENTVRSFGQGAQHFSSVEKMIEAIKKEIAADVTLLVKGSRSMQMERVVSALEANH
jgi:UDP-N-acetylmuramoyl-tripeptide--D-alanyl-D-alanine ligase